CFRVLVRSPNARYAGSMFCPMVRRACHWYGSRPLPSLVRPEAETVALSAETMKTSLDGEVIVVGAGPAGAATAYYLARRGRRVILLERRTFPRDKSCGDGLTRPAVRLLNEMGVMPMTGPVQHVHGVRVFMRGRGCREFRYPDGGAGLVVPRFDLDSAISRQAVNAGAQL